jgi:hypothetical protein
MLCKRSFKCVLDLQQTQLFYFRDSNIIVKSHCKNAIDTNVIVANVIVTNTILTNIIVTEVIVTNFVLAKVAAP